MRAAVTGAYGYSGQYIARRLLEAGHEVVTLTNSLTRDHPLRPSVPAFPLRFGRPAEIVRSLAGAHVLVNTYWVRFNSRRFTFRQAIENSRVLFVAAKAAGVKRVVHVSITNPSADSDLEYFRGKALVEEALLETGLAYTILRPTVLFGREDILINNIAWLLRHLPVFGVFGDGEYRLQPIYVGDLAELAVRAAGSSTNEIINAVGPETFSYRGLVQAIGYAIDRRRRIVSVSPSLGYALGWMVGKLVRDVVITRQEIQGLMEGRLHVDTPPTGHTKLTDWARANRDWLGNRYASEMARRLDRAHRYEALHAE